MKITFLKIKNGLVSGTIFGFNRLEEGGGGVRPIRLSVKMTNYQLGKKFCGQISVIIWQHESRFKILVGLVIGHFCIFKVWSHKKKMSYTKMPGFD